MKSHGQALEEELCFPGVLSYNSDAPANLLRHFYGCLMPCTCCLDGRRTEDVGAGQTGVFVRLLLFPLLRYGVYLVWWKKRFSMTVWMIKRQIKP